MDLLMGVLAIIAAIFVSLLVLWLIFYIWYDDGNPNTQKRTTITLMTGICLCAIWLYDEFNTIEDMGLDTGNILCIILLSSLVNQFIHGKTKIPMEVAIRTFFASNFVIVIYLIYLDL